jgi:hypothetical protein
MLASRVVLVNFSFCIIFYNLNATPGKVGQVLRVHGGKWNSQNPHRRSRSRRLRMHHGFKLQKI